MARSAVRTTTLSRDVVVRMLDLFGTIKNTYDRLGVNGLMTYHQFYRGMSHETVTPSQKTLVEESWERWQFLYLREEVPASSDFTITPENRESVPSWHPETEEEEDEAEFDPNAYARRTEPPLPPPRARVRR